MSLPLPAVERLFARLMTTYGREFMALYAGQDLAAVKSSWAHELAGFSANLPAIAWALENLPESAPNAIRFRNLARQAPQPEAPRLPEPQASPERMRAELAKLGDIRPAVRGPGVDIGWAHRIMARIDGGARLSPTVAQMARDAIERHGRMGVEA